MTGRADTGIGFSAEASACGQSQLWRLKRVNGILFKAEEKMEFRTHGGGSSGKTPACTWAFRAVVCISVLCGLSDLVCSVCALTC